MRGVIGISAFVILALLCIQSTHAVDYQFVGCLAGLEVDFHNYSNWSPVGVPGASDSAFITGATCQILISVRSSHFRVDSSRPGLSEDCGRPAGFSAPEAPFRTPSALLIR